MKVVIDQYQDIMEFYMIVFLSSDMCEKHNKKHHIYTNKKEDPDINIIPFLRITQNQPIYWYHKYQHFYQYFLFTLGAFSLRIQGLYYIYLKNLTKLVYFIWFKHSFFNSIYNIPNFKMENIWNIILYIS